MSLRGSSVGSGTHLDRNHLASWKVVVLALAYLQLGPSAALSAGGIIPFSGPAAWLATLLAMSVMTLLALIVGAFARRWVVTGSLVSYAYEALGPSARAVVAACLVLGYGALAASVVAQVVVFTSSVLLDLGILRAASLSIQAASSIVVSVLAAACAWRGVDVSVRVVLILGVLSLPLSAVATIGAFVYYQGPILPQFDTLHFSVQQIAQGAVAATGYCVGFDGVASLAAEARDPKHSIPRVLLGSMIIFGAVMTLSCLLQSPALSAHESLLAAGASPIAILAEVMHAHWLAILGDVLLLPATVAGVVALYNFGARTIATTAADGLLPAVLGAIHPRFRSPHFAVAALATVGALAPIALKMALRAPPLLSSVYLSNLATYYWLIPYFIISAGILRVMHRERYERGRSIVTLAAAWVSMFSIGYVVVALFRSPADTGTTFLPYLAILTIGILGGVFLLATYTRKRITEDMEHVL